MNMLPIQLPIVFLVYFSAEVSIYLFTERLFLVYKSVNDVFVQVSSTSVSTLRSFGYLNAGCAKE